MDREAKLREVRAQMHSMQDTTLLEVFTFADFLLGDLTDEEKINLDFATQQMADMVKQAGASVSYIVMSGCLFALQSVLPQGGSLGEGRKKGRRLF